MVRIISKPKRRAAVFIMISTFLIGFIARFDFWNLPSVYQNTISGISLLMMLAAFFYLIANTNIWRLASPYSSGKHNLDEREVLLQLETYHKSYRILDFFFALIMLFVYLFNDSLKEVYPKLGWLLLVCSYLLIRLLPIMILAWTEEEV